MKKYIQAYHNFYQLLYRSNRQYNDINRIQKEEILIKNIMCSKECILLSGPKKDILRYWKIQGIYH